MNKVIKLSFRTCFLGTLFLLILSCNQKPLPIYGEHPIEKFQFLNQDSVLINNNTFDKSIYVADFFFTSCTTICPVMHKVMKELYDDYSNDNKLMFLSHTIDYKYDKPSRLKTYAKKLGVDDKRWQFAYGKKEEIYKIAEKSYLSTVIEDSTADQGFIHQGYLILIDKNRLIRGAYDATKPEQVEDLKRDIKILMKE